MSPTYELTARDFVRILNRWRTIIIACVFAGVTGANLYGLAQIPLYTAEASVLLDTRKMQVVNIQAVMSGLPTDFAAIRSELDILNSNDLAAHVVERAGLMDDPEFAPTAPLTGHKADRLGWRERAARMLQMSRWLPEDIVVRLGLERPPEKTLENGDAKPIDEVVDAFQRHLNVLYDGRSYTIRVQFNSVSPEKATRIANLITEVYIQDQLRSKLDANQHATQWLNEQIIGLRDEVRRTETAVQEFRARNQLIESRGATVSDQQLSELNTQLILARSERAQAEARLARIRELEASNVGLDAAREVLSSSLIQRLREQQSDLLRREAELSAVYDEKHPKMVNIRAEMRDFNRTIKEEMDKVASAVANDVAVARSRESTIASSLAALERLTADANKADVELKALQRDADANRNLLQTYLNRAKETGSQEDLQHPDARIISPASLPKASSSVSLVTLSGMSFLVSLLIGISLALLLERLDNHFMTPVQLHLATRLPVYGMLPNVSGSRSVKPQDYPDQKPRSAFSEALRTIRLAIRSPRDDTAPKIILVTSSVEGEGKTTFSAAFAKLTARSGGRVLAIDCDSRRPQLREQLGLSPIASLEDLVKSRLDISALPSCSDEGGIHFMAPPADTPEAQDFFGSAKMVEFLKAMSARYDLVLLDCPPVMAVSIPSVLSSMADACLYLVRWNKTSRDLVTNGVAQLQRARCKSIGFVLTRVDLRRHRRLGYGDQAHYYGEYSDYYVG